MGNTCAVHPGTAASFACSRCGSFACVACTSSVDGLCAKCDALRGAVLGTDVSAESLVGDSFSLVAKFGAAVAIFAVIEAVASTGVGMLRGALPASLPFIILTALISIAVSTVIQAAWISMLASAAQGTPIDIGQAFARAGAVALPLLGCNIFLGLAVGLASVFLIIPGIIVALGLCTAGSSVVVARQGPFEALSESWSVTSGHKGTLFLAFLATGLVAFVVSVVVGMIGNLALAQLPAAVAPVGTVATGALASVATAPVLTVPVLAYLRIKRNFAA